MVGVDNMTKDIPGTQLYKDTMVTGMHTRHNTNVNIIEIGC